MIHSRWAFVIPFTVVGLLVVFAFQATGPSAWKIWNIPTLQPSFVDARIITASAESYRLGFDPAIENPRDPFGRLFNLPAAWKVLFLTKLDQSHTDRLAGFFIASFLLGLIPFLTRLTPPSNWIVALCAFSPPVMLAIERGNVDLFVFFVCAIALLWVERNLPISAILLFGAGMLKIYPLFGLISFFHLERKRFLNFLAYPTILFIVYILLTFNTFRRVFANTEIGLDFSYGLGVLPLYIEQLTGSAQYYAISILLSYLFVILVAGACLHEADRSVNALTGENQLYLSAFRLGAGIYLGTFLLGNNWDYRLMFLLFTLPQLIEWAKQDKAAKFTLICILVSFAYLWIAMRVPFAYFVDELANWLVFAGFFYLVMVSSPGWIRNEIHLFFWRAKHKMRLV